jgi:tape measure domain-containing protein
MTSAIRQLYVTLKLQADSYNNALRQAQRETRELEKTIRPTMKLVDDLSRTMKTAGVAMTAAVTAPIAAVAGLGIQFNAMQEQAQIAFTTLLGSGEKARRFLEEMKEFAAKTPFEFPDLVRASQRLLAMGFAANQIKPLLTSVGDAAAGLGGSADTIDRITLALGQMAGRGRVATQEMNQLTEVGIPAWRLLAEGMGVSEQKLRDMVEKGLVPADKSIQILQEGMNKAFGGQMAKQAETFSGLLSTIKDEARFIAGDLTTGLFNVVKGPLKTAVETLERMRSTINGLSDDTKAWIAIFGVGLASIGPALLIVSGGLFAIKQTIEGIILLRAGLFATISVISGVGAVSSLAEARIALGLYAESVWAIHGAWVATAAVAAAYLALAYEIYQLGNAIADLVEAKRDAARASSEFEASVKTLEERLRSEGVVIDRGKMSLEEYAIALQKAGQAKWLNPDWLIIQQQWEKHLRDLDEALRRIKEREMAAAEAAKAHAAEVKRVTESFQQAFRPADELARELDILLKKYMVNDVIAVYGQKIDDAARIQVGFNGKISETIRVLDTLYLRMKSAEALKSGFADLEKEAASGLQSLLDKLSPRKDVIQPLNLPIPRIANDKEEIEFLSSMELQAGYAALKLQNLNSTLKQVAATTSSMPKMPELPPVFTESELARKARTELSEAERSATALGVAIRELQNDDLAGTGLKDAQIIGLLGGNLETAAKNAELLGIKLDEQTIHLINQIDATKKAEEEAKRWERTWSQVLANITTEFVSGLSSLILRGRDIGSRVGRTFIEAFFAELFNPLTNLLAGWGRALATQLQTSVMPRIAGAIGLGSLLPKVAGAATKTAAQLPIDPAVAGTYTGLMGGGGGAGAAAGAHGFFGLSGAQLGAFFSNPFTIGVGAAIGAGLLVKHFVGRGRRAADDFGGAVERPFGQQLGLIVDEFNSAKGAGSLSLAEAKTTRDELVALQRQFISQSAEFAAQGDAQRKVVEQAIAGHNANFGPNLSRILDDVNTTIASLAKGQTVGGIPQTGLALSASSKIDAAADKFLQAADKFLQANAAKEPQAVQENHYEQTVNITIEGSGKSTRELMEEIDAELKSGNGGFRAGWTRIFSQNKGVVVN